ncbi:cyclic di-GMP phosphodiesterase response regulator RpfG [Geobacter sp. OR-1]|uniref:HD-GYP domain-containing protein n=1 Tax=Geobacter sp. OR-1 TaxID=1266765 RepID=UPI0005424B7C|nr:HD domain-containing phosphohydrolase [Geobacter sp. OR-1]GAM11090.1 cyclic di-GMP phosphodiesterase response regulator RpfG [Geobacter sp. OR-1]
MSNESCEMALQQLQELLRLTETEMRRISRRRFCGSELYVEALAKVLGGRGRRGPACIMILFSDRAHGAARGRVFHLVEHELVERSDQVVIDLASAYGSGMALTEAGEDVVAVNWNELSATIEDFQKQFPEAVRRFVSGPIRNFVTCRIAGERQGVVSAFNYPGNCSTYDATVLRGLSVLISSLVTLSGELWETEQAFIYTIEALARACEAAEEDTGNHIKRVNRYAGALAANMGVPDQLVDTISYSAQMHDVGKIKIPSAILLKKGPLDHDEMELIRQHPAFGEQILGDSQRLQVAREIAIAHHENWDGSGYPSGLKGESIPLPGRIVKLADVYDALRSNRSYKPGYTHAETMRIFHEGDERIKPRSHFDPAVLETFFRIERIFDAIYESLHG